MTHNHCRYDPCTALSLDECATSVEPKCTVDSQKSKCIDFSGGGGNDFTFDCFSLVVNGSDVCNAAVKAVNNDTTEFNADPRACYFVEKSASDRPACLKYNKCRSLSKPECKAGGDGSNCFWNKLDKVCDLDWAHGNPSNGGGTDNGDGGGGGMPTGGGGGGGGSGSGQQAPEDGACESIQSHATCDEAIYEGKATHKTRRCRWGRVSEIETDDDGANVAGIGGDGSMVGQCTTTDHCQSRTTSTCNVTGACEVRAIFLTQGSNENPPLPNDTDANGGGSVSPTPVPGGTFGSRSICAKAGSLAAGYALPCDEFVSEGTCNDNPGTDGKLCQWKVSSENSGSGSGQPEPDSEVCYRFDWCSISDDEEACAATATCKWRSDVGRCEYDPTALELPGAAHSLDESGTETDATDCDQLADAKECSSRDFEDPIHWTSTFGNLTRCMWTDNSQEYCLGYDEDATPDTSSTGGGLDGDGDPDPAALARAQLCGQAEFQSSKKVCEAAVSDSSSDPSARACRWMVDSKGRCSNWQNCQGRKDTTTVKACEARLHCVWHAFFETCTDEHLMTTSTTSSVTQTFATFEPCPAGRFSCGNGQCIPAGWKCDGHEDCGKKGEPFWGADESPGLAGCSTSTTPTTTTTQGKPKPPKSTTKKATTATATSTSRTTQATKRTSTSTATMTTTSTTLPACVLNGVCDSVARFQAARNTRNPLFSTPAECRACALDTTVAAVCSHYRTRGCNSNSNSNPSNSGTTTSAATASSTPTPVLLASVAATAAANPIDAGLSSAVTTQSPSAQTETVEGAVDGSKAKKTRTTIAVIVILICIFVGLAAVFAKIRMQAPGKAANLQEQMVAGRASAYSNPAYAAPPGVVGSADPLRVVHSAPEGSDVRPDAGASAYTPPPPSTSASPVTRAGGRHSPSGAAATFMLQPISESAPFAAPGPSAGGLAPVLTLRSGLEQTLEC